MVKHIVPVLKCGVSIVTSFQIVPYEQDEERVDLQWRDLKNTASARRSRFTSTVINHADNP